MLLITFDVKILKLSFIGRLPGTNCYLLIPRYQNLFTLSTQPIKKSHAQTHNTIYFFLESLFFFLGLLSAKIFSSEEEGGRVEISSVKFNLSLLDFLCAGLINLKNEASNSGISCKGFMILSMLSARQAPSFRENLIPTLSGCNSPSPPYLPSSALPAEASSSSTCQEWKTRFSCFNVKTNLIALC